MNDMERVLKLMQDIRDLFSDETNNYRRDLPAKTIGRLEAILDILTMIHIDLVYERRNKK